jgi:hypothetical protein
LVVNVNGRLTDELDVVTSMLIAPPSLPDCPLLKPLLLTLVVMASTVELVIATDPPRPAAVHPVNVDWLMLMSDAAYNKS